MGLSTTKRRYISVWTFYLTLAVSETIGDMSKNRKFFLFHVLNAPTEGLVIEIL